MAHREGIREYFNSLEFGGIKIVDWGCGTKPIKNYINHKDCTFFNIDVLRQASVPADLVIDMCSKMPALGDRLFDVAFCLEVLEHVNYPWAALANIYKFLKPGGTFYFSVPFLYDVHSEHDLWRFTDQGLEFMLRKTGFQLIEIQPTENKMGWVGRAVK